MKNWSASLVLSGLALVLSACNPAEPVQPGPDPTPSPQPVRLQAAVQAYQGTLAQLTTQVRGIPAGQTLGRDWTRLSLALGRSRAWTADVPVDSLELARYLMSSQNVSGDLRQVQGGAIGPAGLRPLLAVAAQQAEEIHAALVEVYDSSFVATAGSQLQSSFSEERTIHQIWTDARAGGPSGVDTDPGTPIESAAAGEVSAQLICPTVRNLTLEIFDLRGGNPLAARSAVATNQVQIQTQTQGRVPLLVRTRIEGLSRGDLDQCRLKLTYPRGPDPQGKPAQAWGANQRGTTQGLIMRLEEKVGDAYTQLDSARYSEPPSVDEETYASELALIARLRNTTSLGEKYALDSTTELLSQDARLLAVDINHSAELEMISLQSLVSQRSLVVQLTTGILQSINESLRDIIKNIGGDSGPRPDGGI